MYVDSAHKTVNLGANIILSYRPIKGFKLRDKNKGRNSRKSFLFCFGVLYAIYRSVIKLTIFVKYIM